MGQGCTGTILGQGHPDSAERSEGRPHPTPGGGVCSYSVRLFSFPLCHKPHRSLGNVVKSQGVTKTGPLQVVSVSPCLVQSQRAAQPRFRRPGRAPVLSPELRRASAVLTALLGRPGATRACGAPFVSPSALETLA